jgi:hypothetical protein
MARRDTPTDEARKAAPSTGSEVDRQLAALEQLAEQLGVQVCYEPMTGVVSGAGGLCRVKGTYRAIIDRRLKPRERMQILADALSRFDLSSVTLSAEVEPLVLGAMAKASA